MRDEHQRERAAANAYVHHADGVLEMRRVFHASREQVFAAWTRAEHFSKWFGPHGASMPHCRIDLRVGGELHFLNRVPGDMDVWCKGVFQRVEPPRRIAFLIGFSDADGRTVERPGFPLESTIDVMFADHPQGTEITLRHCGLVIDQGEIQGWQQGFERLDAVLAMASIGPGVKR